MDEERLRKIAGRLMTAAQTRLAIDPPAAEASLDLSKNHASGPDGVFGVGERPI